MFNRFKERIFGSGQSEDETPVRMHRAVHDLLASDEIPVYLSSEEKVIAERINKLKGTHFGGTPGYIISVMETGVDQARLLGQHFDLSRLLLVMDGKVRRNGIPVDLDDPSQVDAAWERYFKETR